MTCTFFGHKDTPYSIKDKLREQLIDLIENQGANKFYVGNHGSFDRMAASVLRELKGIYPNIEFRIVLAYLPNYEINHEETEFPEGIENVPKRFAIDYRNKWMIKKADAVVAYIAQDLGGAAKFVKLAERRELRVINLFEVLSK